MHFYYKNYLWPETRTTGESLVDSPAGCTAKMPEEVNRKCRPGITTVHLSTP